MSEFNGNTIPTINQLKVIAESLSIQVNEEMDPKEGFEAFNRETQSGFSSLMTEDLDLFSIDFYNPTDTKTVEALIKVLSLYNVPTNKLKNDIERAYKNKENFITNYKHFWVEYRPDDEEPNVVLIRYREFVNE